MPDTRLQIVISAKDLASKEVKKFNDNLKTLQPTFKKMAIAGTAGLAAITVGLKQTIDEAAFAEGALAKFEAVFKDNTDAMLEFVDGLRKEMPSSRAEIIRMAADLQDLLVPMGISRDAATGMSQDFLELSNKVAAFNDVSPERVLEAMKSGLVGASEPLRAFGVDARISSLEAIALEEGLIGAGESLASLDPAVRSSVQAQALLLQATKQSSDAIEGFAENNDSFIRRQQNLQATLKDTKEAIGKALLPVIDNLVKAILPVIEKVAAWIQQNPELTKVILIAVTALTALLAIIGFIGLALPPLIAGFGLLFSPITLITLLVGGLIAAGVLLVKNWDLVKSKLQPLVDAFTGAWNQIKEVTLTVFTSIRDFIDSVLDSIMSGIEKIRGGFSSITGFVGSVGDSIGNLLQFSSGGLVPGMLGQPQLAVVHGGERVLPAQGLRGRGVGSVSVNISGNTISSDVDVDRMAEVMQDKIMESLESDQLI